VEIFGTLDPRPPLQASIDRWAGMLHCPLPAHVLRDRDGVKAISYGPCDGGSGVVSYTIAGMGHTWPGGRRHLPKFLVGKSTDAIDAVDLIWEFFAKHPKT
jgi:polyhydroxybutyrate depolymerase